MVDIDKINPSVLNNSIGSNDSIGNLSTSNRNQWNMHNNSILSEPEQILANVHTYNDSYKMISLSKSKEYSKLASQVPSIFTIENGQKIPTRSDLRQAGIKAINTRQEKYRQNILELKDSIKLNLDTPLNPKPLTGIKFFRDQDVNTRRSVNFTTLSTDLAPIIV